MEIYGVFLVIFLLLSVSLGQQFQSNTYEFEDLKQSNSNADWVWRSEAEQLQALRMEHEDHKTLTLTLCARPSVPNIPVEAFIENVRYSNDGDSDTVTFSINNVQLASFNTDPEWAWGLLWNVFMDTGTIGRRFRLVQGDYQMNIQASTDFYGIELDKISIRTKGQTPGENLICGAQFGGSG